MAALASPVASHFPELAGPNTTWGARDLDAFETLRPGAVTLVRVEAGAGGDLLRGVARGAWARDAGGLVRAERLRLSSVAADLARVDARVIVLAGLSDAALLEDDGRTLLVEAAEAARSCALRLQVPVLLIERARRLSAAHPLHGVLEAAADEVVALRRGGVVELPRRGAQFLVNV